MWNPDLWREADHPRDRLGRFRSKWKVAGAAKELLDSILQVFNPREFRSPQEAQVYLRQRMKSGTTEQQRSLRDYSLNNYKAINAELKAGRTSPETDNIDAMMQPLPDDLVVAWPAPASTFGLDPASLPAIEEATGKLVRFKGYTNTWMGSAEAPPGGVSVHLLAPRGTPATSFGGAEVMLGRDMDMRVIRVEENGKGGYRVYGAVMPKGVGEDGQSPRSAIEEGMREGNEAAKEQGLPQAPEVLPPEDASVPERNPAMDPRASESAPAPAAARPSTDMAPVAEVYRDGKKEKLTPQPGNEVDGRPSWVGKSGQPITIRPGRTAGTVGIFDGDRMVAEAPDIEMLPGAAGQAGLPEVARWARGAKTLPPDQYGSSAQGAATRTREARGGTDESRPAVSSVKPFKGAKAPAKKAGAAPTPEGGAKAEPAGAVKKVAPKSPPTSEGEDSNVVDMGARRQARLQAAKKAAPAPRPDGQEATVTPIKKGMPAVKKSTAAPVKQLASPGDEFDKMRKAELAERAKAKGMTVTPRTTAEELRKFLRGGTAPKSTPAPAKAIPEAPAKKAPGKRLPAVTALREDNSRRMRASDVTPAGEDEKPADETRAQRLARIRRENDARLRDAGHTPAPRPSKATATPEAGKPEPAKAAKKAVKKAAPARKVTPEAAPVKKAAPEAAPSVDSPKAGDSVSWKRDREGSVTGTVTRVTKDRVYVKWDDGKTEGLRKKDWETEAASGSISLRSPRAAKPRSLRKAEVGDRVKWVAASDGETVEGAVVTKSPSTITVDWDGGRRERLSLRSPKSAGVSLIDDPAPPPRPPVAPVKKAALASPSARLRPREVKVGDTIAKTGNVIYRGKASDELESVEVAKIEKEGRGSYRFLDKDGNLIADVNPNSYVFRRTEGPATPAPVKKAAPTRKAAPAPAKAAPAKKAAKKAIPGTLGERLQQEDPERFKKELRDGLKKEGIDLGGLEGDTAEEVFDDALKKIVQREMNRRQAAKKAAAAVEQLVETAETPPAKKAAKAIKKAAEPAKKAAPAKKLTPSQAMVLNSDEVEQALRDGKITKAQAVQNLRTTASTHREDAERVGLGAPTIQLTPAGRLKRGLANDRADKLEKLASKIEGTAPAKKASTKAAKKAASDAAEESTIRGLRLIAQGGFRDSEPTTAPAKKATPSLPKRVPAKAGTDAMSEEATARRKDFIALAGDRSKGSKTRFGSEARNKAETDFANGRDRADVAKDLRQAASELAGKKLKVDDVYLSSDKLDPDASRDSDVQFMRDLADKLDPPKKSTPAKAVTAKQQASRDKAASLQERMDRLKAQREAKTTGE